MLLERRASAHAAACPRRSPDIRRGGRKRPGEKRASGDHALCRRARPGGAGAGRTFRDEPALDTGPVQVRPGKPQMLPRRADRWLRGKLAGRGAHVPAGPWRWATPGSAESGFSGDQNGQRLRGREGSERGRALALRARDHGGGPCCPGESELGTGDTQFGLWVPESSSPEHRQPVPEFWLQGQGRAQEFFYEGRTFQKQRVPRAVGLPPPSCPLFPLRKSVTEQTAGVALTNQKGNLSTNNRIVPIPARQAPAAMCPSFRRPGRWPVPGRAGGP